MNENENVNEMIFARPPLTPYERERNVNENYSFSYKSYIFDENKWK